LGLADTLDSPRAKRKFASMETKGTL